MLEYLDRLKVPPTLSDRGFFYRPVTNIPWLLSCFHSNLMPCLVVVRNNTKTFWTVSLQLLPCLSTKSLHLSKLYMEPSILHIFDSWSSVHAMSCDWYDFGIWIHCRSSVENVQNGARSPSYKQGGPTELYSGNLSILCDVWEVSSHFSRIYATLYRPWGGERKSILASAKVWEYLISGVKSTWTSLYRFQICTLECKFISNMVASIPPPGYLLPPARVSRNLLGTNMRFTEYLTLDVVKSACITTLPLMTAPRTPWSPTGSRSSGQSDCPPSSKPWWQFNRMKFIAQNIA